MTTTSHDSVDSSTVGTGTDAFDDALLGFFVAEKEVTKEDDDDDEGLPLIGVKFDAVIVDVVEVSDSCVVDVEEEEEVLVVVDKRGDGGTFLNATYEEASSSA